MNSGLQIADMGSIPSIIEAVNNSNGDVIVRIGVGSSSGGFDTPQAYIKFLKELGDSLPPGASVFAIAGPNEPDLEGWLSPECMNLLPINPADMLCGGRIDEKPVGYRGEVVGHNGEIPWSINSNLHQQKDLIGGTVEGQLASTLQAEFIIRVPPNTFRHNDFRVVSDQMVGSLDPDDPNNLYFEDRLRDEDGFISPLKANMPIFNSALPGVKIPSSYSVGINETFQFAESNETPEAYLERIFKKTPEPGDGRKPEFGWLTEMPAMVFRACIQRSACNLGVEECLRADGSGELCDGSDDAEDCRPFGRTFNLTGRIGHREPTELHSISRSFELQKRQLVDRPGEPTSFGAVVTQEDLSRSTYVFKDPDLNELADGMKYIQEISQNRNTNYKTSSGKEVTVANTNNGSLIKPAVANAQGDPMAQPQGSLGVVVIELGGNQVQIDYETCVWHQLGSACAIRDVSTTINGQGTFNYIPVTQANIPRCLKPSWGNAPVITADLAPGTCTTLSVHTRGGRVGPEGCSDTYQDSCEICRANDGTITQTCGIIPPPPPVDCSQCASWAPSWLCAPIIADPLPEETECADGACTSSGKISIEKEIPWQDDDDDPDDINDWIINWLDRLREGDFTWLSGLLAGLLETERTGVRCDIDYSLPSESPGGIRFPIGIECWFGSRDYLVYAYPITYIGDFGERTVDMSINNAMFRLSNKTDQYFWPQSTKAPVTLKLSLRDPTIDDETVRFEVPNGSERGFEIGAQNTFYLGLNDSGERTMFVEYYYFMQPQTSGQCLKQRFLSQPIPLPGGGTGVPLSHNTLCGSQDFWTSGITSGDTTSAVDQRMMAAVEQIEQNLLATTDSQDKVAAEINLDQDIVPQIRKLYEQDKHADYAGSKIMSNMTLSEVENLQNQFLSEFEIILNKYFMSSGKGVFKDINDTPESMEKELDALVRKYDNRVSAIVNN